MPIDLEKAAQSIRVLVACAFGATACAAGTVPYDEPSDEPSAGTGGHGGAGAGGRAAPGGAGGAGAGAPTHEDAAVVADAGTEVTTADASRPDVVPSAEGCANATVPRAGLWAWLSAESGVKVDGTAVTEWRDQASPTRVARPTSGRPTLVAKGRAGRPVVRFDGTDDELTWPSLPISGRQEMTIAMVCATELKKPRAEWCCHDGETGCSGTYHLPLAWRSTVDWSGIQFGPVQEEITAQFRNEVKSYSPESTFYKPLVWGGSGYGSCRANPPRDPLVAWRRPSSIGNRLTTTIAVKGAREVNVWSDGAKAYSYPMWNGRAALGRANDFAIVGSGPFKTRRWKGDIAEIVLYERALDDRDREALQRYLTCKTKP